MKEEEEFIFESEEEVKLRQLRNPLASVLPCECDIVFTDEISEEEVSWTSEEEFVISDEEEEESELDIASEDEVQMKSKLKSTSPEWNPNSQWPIRCVNCQEKYPEDHDGEGFEQGGWYCPECWDIEFL